MLKKSTVIIDGNYFIFSRLFVLPKPKKIPGLPDPVFMESEKDRGVLMRKLAIDFASEFRKLKYLANRIIFVLDSKSWRKDFFPDSGYKENRKDDPKRSQIDWSGVSEITRGFSDFLEQKGVIVEKVDGAEGDDLIFAWVTQLNSLGENCIIWSGDKDLMQLVNYNKSTDSYTLWYDNTRNIMGVYPGFNKWLETEEAKPEFDMFAAENSIYLNDQIKLEFKNYIGKNNIKTQDVFCDEFALIKILTGDKSDNISSVYEKPSKNGNRNFRFSEKKAKSLLSTFKKRHNRFSAIYLFEDSYKDEICQIVSREMKVSGKLDEIKRNLDLNIRLILLHVNTIPEAIQISMFEQIKEDIDRSLNLDHSGLSSMDTILEGSKYLDQGQAGSGSKGTGAIGILF